MPLCLAAHSSVSQLIVFSVISVDFTTLGRGQTQTKRRYQVRESFRIISSFLVERPEVKKWQNSRHQPGGQDFVTVLFHEKSYFIHSGKKISCIDLVLLEAI